MWTTSSFEDKDGICWTQKLQKNQFFIHTIGYHRILPDIVCMWIDLPHHDILVTTACRNLETWAVSKDHWTAPRRSYQLQGAISERWLGVDVCPKQRALLYWCQCQTSPLPCVSMVRGPWSLGKDGGFFIGAWGLWIFDLCMEEWLNITLQIIENAKRSMAMTKISVSKKVKVQFFLPKPVEHLQTLKDVNSLTQCNTFNHQSYVISDMNLVYQSQTFTVIHSWPRWGRTWGRIWSVKWKAQRQPFRDSQHHRLVKALSSLQDTLICEEESSAKCPRNLKHLQISDFSLKTHCSNIHCHASCHFLAKLEAIL